MYYLNLFINISFFKSSFFLLLSGFSITFISKVMLSLFTLPIWTIVLSSPSSFIVSFTISFSPEYTAVAVKHKLEKCYIAFGILI